jgi:PEGA domain
VDASIGELFGLAALGANMHSLYKVAALAAAAGSLAACATVTRGSSTAWEVNTTPPGATVRTSNGMICESTPCSITMSRKAEFSATISKPGYKSVDMKVTTKIATAGGAGMAGNVLLGGLIGAGVDVATGAMNDLTPNPVNIVMEKDEAKPAVTAAAPEPAKAVAPPAAQPPAAAGQAKPAADQAKPTSGALK